PGRGGYAHAQYERGLLARLDLLLTYGALDSLETSKMSDSDSALHEAACMHDLTSVERLWNDKRVDGMKTDYHEETPLHPAARGGNLEVVKFLLKEGVDP